MSLPLPPVPVKSTKATITAIGTFLTLVAVIIEDNVVDMNEWGQIITGLIGLVGTVYSTWRVPNEPKV